MTPSRFLFPVCLLLAAPQIHAAIYLNDFNGTDAVSKFTNEDTDARWTVIDGVYRNSITANNVPTTASFSTTGVAGNNFTITTQFTATSITGPAGNAQHTVGFGLFGTNADFTGNGYYADYVIAAGGTSAEGVLRIIRAGDPASSNGLADPNTTSGSLAVILNTTYTLRLTGTYNGLGHLSLSLGLFNADGSTQIGTSTTYTDTSPFSGQYFGYRNRSAGSTGTNGFVVDMDNYALIPEPSSALLAIPGILCLMRRRR